MAHVRDSFREFNDNEVHAGWVYAKTSRPKDNFVGVVTDKDLLRKIGNEVGQRKKPGVILPALTGVVCREYLRQRNIVEERTYEAYLCGVMKMFADRRGRQASREAAQKKAKTPVREVRQKYAELPSGQFLLPLPRPKGSTKRTSG